MNTEDRLRRASQEMERVTSSVTAPPITTVRRLSRIRSASVALVAAIGALILVGGAVLALRPAGETAIPPVAPEETPTTTTADPPDTTFDTLPVRAAEPGPSPLFDTGPLGEQLPATFPASAEADMALALEQLEVRGEGLRYGTVEAISLGSGRGLRGYVLIGELEGRVTDSKFAYCTAVVSDSDLFTDCVGEDTSPVLELNSIGLNSFALLGALPDGSSVVALELGDQKVWTLAREGFVFMTRPDRTEPAVVTVYAADGEVLDWNGDSQDPTLSDDVEPVCSGAALQPSALALSSVPQPVAQALFAIVEAAQSCYFEVLEGIAGPNFTASFGGGDPAELWAYEEEQGYEPMAWLMKVLDLPYGTVDLGDELVYVWPAAAAHDGGWDTMPEEYIDDLRAIYSEEDLQGFADFGDYIGYRAGIYENGDWSFFVAGD